MRQVIGLVVLLAGCASPGDYRPGPPITVAEPTYSGPPIAAPRPNSASAVGVPNTMQPPCEPIAPPRPTTFIDWLRSGRGWTWGRASREPIRDEGLDRLMVDTLTSDRPLPSREPLPPVSCVPNPGESWIYPATPRSAD